MCDGGDLTETFLKTATLSVLVWAYPREMKTNNGNLKKYRNFASLVLIERQNCRSFSFVLVKFLVCQKHAHSFCLRVDIRLSSLRCNTQHHGHSHEQIVMELVFFLKFQAEGFLRNSYTETFVDSGQLFNFELI